jgi:hypothetical protein
MYCYVVLGMKMLRSCFIMALLFSALAIAAHSGATHASTDVSGVPKPSILEFTVKFVNASYTVTTTNPYTGVDETQQISNNSIEVTIKNQPFDYSNNGLTYFVYFDVRIKPRFSSNWTEVYPLQNRTSSYNEDGTFSYAEYVSPDSPTQSKSSYTVISFRVVPTELYGASGYDIQRYYSGDEGQEGTYFAFLSAVPLNGQVDFQVEAIAGHDSQAWYIQHPLFPQYGGYYEPAVDYDTTSGWSSTQTITIGESQTPTPSPAATPTPTPNQEPQQTEQEIIIGVAIAAAVIIAFLVIIYIIKRK